MVERSLNPHPGREVEQIMSSCGLRAFPNVQDTPKGSGLSRSPLIVAVPIIHMATMKRQRPLTKGLKWGSVWSWDETGHSETPGPGPFDLRVDDHDHRKHPLTPISLSTKDASSVVSR